MATGHFTHVDELRRFADRCVVLEEVEVQRPTVRILQLQQHNRTSSVHLTLRVHYQVQIYYLQKFLLEDSSLSRSDQSQKNRPVSLKPRVNSIIVVVL